MAKIKIKTLDHFDSSFGLPQYETCSAAGADLKASLHNKDTLIINPGSRVLIPTGLCMEIEAGYEVQIRPRSGLSLKTQLLIPNSPGTIDADYRGEVQIIMANLGHENYVVKHGDRIAQMVLNKIIQAQFEIVEDLTESARGSAGFGSTGI